MQDMVPEMLAGGFVSPESGEKQFHGKKNDKNSLLPIPCASLLSLLSNCSLISLSLFFPLVPK